MRQIKIRAIKVKIKYLDLDLDNLSFIKLFRLQSTKTFLKH